jgi:phosphatidate phosphatase APP1
MPAPKIFAKLLSRLDHFVDDLRFRLLKVTGKGAKLPIKIVPYRGFGRSDYIFLQGRVLVKKRLRMGPRRTIFHQLLHNYIRFETDEIPNAVLRVDISEHQFDLVTDQEGYFTLNAKLDPPLLLPDDDPWQNVKITLLETPWTDNLELEASTSVLFPPKDAKLGVISDLDDTVIETGVYSLLKWRAIYNTLFKSADRRRVFDQVAAFFRALNRGVENNGFQPIFYVSNSPRNIYGLVKAYLRFHDLPKAPLLLRDIGIPYKLHPRDLGHKKESIISILEAYPEMQFILIGDNAEKDPYLYHEIDRAYPGRIVAIFIRNVQHIRPLRRLEEFVEKESAYNIQMFNSYRQLAKIAADKGFIELEYFQKMVQSPFHFPFAGWK